MHFQRKNLANTSRSLPLPKHPPPPVRGVCGWTVIFNLLWVPPKLPFVKVICSPPPPTTRCNPTSPFLRISKGTSFCCDPLSFHRSDNEFINWTQRNVSVSIYWVEVDARVWVVPAQTRAAHWRKHNDPTIQESAFMRSLVQILSDKSSWPSHRWSLEF